MELTAGEQSYMEQVAGVSGPAAVERWLYFTEHYRGKSVRRPRYLKAGKTLVEWDTEIGRDDTGLPKGCSEPDRGELLKHVLLKIRRAQHPQKAAKHKLQEAIDTTPMPPCIKFACPKYDDCAARQLACYAFWWWSDATHRRAVSPWTFKDGGEIVTTAEPIATRGVYNKIFSGEK